MATQGEERGLSLVVDKESIVQTVRAKDLALAKLQEEVLGIREMLLVQNCLLEQLVAQQAKIRVTREEEATLRRAIRERSRELADREGLSAKGAGRIAAAIRSTLRDLAGCRALGDVPSAKFDQALRLVRAWDMPGALRRIRREETKR